MYTKECKFRERISVIKKRLFSLILITALLLQNIGVVHAKPDSNASVLYVFKFKQLEEDFIISYDDNYYQMNRLKASVKENYEDILLGNLEIVILNFSTQNKGNDIVSEKRVTQLKSALRSDFCILDKNFKEITEYPNFKNLEDILVVAISPKSGNLEMLLNYNKSNIDRSTSNSTNSNFININSSNPTSSKVNASDMLTSNVERSNITPLNNSGVNTGSSTTNNQMNNGVSKNAKAYVEESNKNIIDSDITSTTNESNKNVGVENTNSTTQSSVKGYIEDKSNAIVASKSDNYPVNSTINKSEENTSKLTANETYLDNSGDNSNVVNQYSQKEIERNATLYSNPENSDVRNSSSTEHIITKYDTTIIYVKHKEIRKVTESEDSIADKRIPIQFRTNLLHWALLAVDGGVEVKLTDQISGIIHGTWTHWKWQDFQRQYRLKRINAEVRYYLSEENKWYAGVGFHSGQYNFKFAEVGTQGDYIGFGLAGGYVLNIGDRIDLDFNLGLGYTKIDYEKYIRDQSIYIRKEKGLVKHYWGITQAGVVLVWRPFSNK